MKRIRVYECGEPEVMKIEEAPSPHPEAGQVVVKVHAVGVNPVDTYIRTGGQGYSPKLPYTPGLDAAGVVESVGDGVTRVSAGDRVYCAGTLSGAYAEKALCDQGQVHPLPQQVSFVQGAGVPVPYATATASGSRCRGTRPYETHRFSCHTPQIPACPFRRRRSVGYGGR